MGLRYLVVIERGETRYGTYVPGLPGCVAVGETVPEPTSQGDYLGVAV